ncbi:MAG: alpha/beta fold hydrolase [Sandaracinaceae bacterium]|nr:alpha/beta fold hydrolase [Sandaracinaceae bacterium]MDW8247596.1 alpha/beta fold hydrolase [Sandaracinaceae bacterium]
MPTASAAPSPPPPLPEPIEVRTPSRDGIWLRGTLYPAPEPDAPLVLLVHQLGSSRKEWEEVIRELRKAPPLAVLAIDLRGHGESTESEGQERISFLNFTQKDWERLEIDVTTMVHYLRGPASPVRPRKIFLVGSSIGATAVIRTAAADPSLEVLALLSPGRAYHGVDVMVPASKLGPRRLLAIASRHESDSAETASVLAKLTQGKALVVDEEGHGVSLLSANSSHLRTLVDFLRENQREAEKR